MKKFIVDKKKSFEAFLERNHNYVLPLILVGGFVGDTLTLNRVDQVFDNLVLVAHLLIVAVTIMLLFARDTSFGRRFRVAQNDSTISAVMLFSFGGLFSGFTIFYSKSGSFISSWPFILGLLILMLGTEIRKKYYQKIILQISIFYIALFSYLIFSVPVLIRKIGAEVYLLSGVVSLLVFSLYALLLYKVDKLALLSYRRKIIVRISAIFIVFNILYFTNIIPPIPLSLTESAVYHDFSKIQGVQYGGFYEETPWWNFWKKRSSTFHRRDNETIYVYSSIYAPVNLNTTIYHRWEYFNPQITRWVETNRVAIPITGGRVDGYRGYSKKDSIGAGSWRVKITTNRGQTIGQINFKIKKATKELNLKEEVFH